MDKFRLHNLSPKQQIQEIVNSADARHLVQSLPAEDLLLLINNVGKNDSLELIELLSCEQLKIIFDLDAWKHESLNDSKLSSWIAALEEANPSAALELARDFDTELITVLLKKYVEIYDLLENDDPVVEADLIMYTLDRHYLLAFNTDEGNEKISRFLKRFLEDLMGYDFLFAIRLIESARFETDTLLHEDLLRLRDGRLQDLGFLPNSERLSILAYLDFDKAKEKIVIPNEKKSEEKSPVKLNYTIPSLKEVPFLREALTGLSHSALENAWGYIVTVANRVHMAQNGSYSNADAVAETAKYTLNMIEMALSYLSDGELSQTKQVYLSYVPQDLFKIGHSIVLRLQRDFIKLGRHPALKLALTSTARLDSPLREVALGILRPEPLFFQGLVDPKSTEYRSFNDLRDVALGSRAISEIAFRCALLGETGLKFEEDASKTHLDLPSMGVLLGTYFSHILLGESGSFEPISAKNLKKLFERLEFSESGRKFSKTDKEKCIFLAERVASNLVGLVGVRSEESAKEKAFNYSNAVLGHIESELSKLKETDLDPKLIQSLLIR